MDAKGVGCADCVHLDVHPKAWQEDHHQKSCKCYSEAARHGKDAPAEEPDELSDSLDQDPQAENLACQIIVSSGEEVEASVPHPDHDYVQKPLPACQR
ncbi:hypothetical protein J4Q44_G00184860 [Coregonus suidteri]|uniref:Uncharacterized protein n=1 Tax=Coregonus suidteri TaxID=861788 RepID=A0AAN8QTG0_9TELE